MNVILRISLLHLYQLTEYSLFSPMTLNNGPYSSVLYENQTYFDRARNKFFFFARARQPINRLFELAYTVIGLHSVMWWTQRRGSRRRIENRRRSRSWLDVGFVPPHCPLNCGDVRYALSISLHGIERVRLLCRYRRSGEPSAHCVRAQRL